MPPSFPSRGPGDESLLYPCCIVLYSFVDFLFFLCYAMDGELGQVFIHAVIQHRTSVVFLLQPISVHLSLLFCL